MGASALRPEDARDPQEVRTTETAGQSAGATAADRPDAATMQATTGSATDADWNRDHSAENPNNPGVPARAVETNVDEVVAKRGLEVVRDDGAIEKAVDDALAANPDIVEKYKAGNKKVTGAIVGAVMKATQGKADPGQVNQLIAKKLAE